jgi:catechol 2,3-dioxygenase-like lactoylglutathione lyase family enzyme
MPELILVGLQAPVALLPELAAFYGERLGLQVARSNGSCVAIGVGETTLELRAAAGRPFYHVALLVPADRFDAALAWCRERVELLPEREHGEVVFDFTNWDAQALYFHDPAGSIVELIAHRGIGEAGTEGPFAARELLGVSEVGVVCDPPALAASLRRELALEVWDGTVEEELRLAFVGEQARTLILCRAGRPWLPTGRPAEAHPVEVVLAGPPDGAVRAEGGVRVVRRTASPGEGPAAVRAS